MSENSIKETQLSKLSKKILNPFNLLEAKTDPLELRVKSRPSSSPDLNPTERGDLASYQCVLSNGKAELEKWEQWGKPCTSRFYCDYLPAVANTVQTEQVEWNSFKFSYLHDLYAMLLNNLVIGLSYLFICCFYIYF